MSEFDLIDAGPSATPDRPVPFESRCLQGEFAHPFLEVAVNGALPQPPLWPGPSEIPGLRAVSPATGEPSSPFSWERSAEGAWSVLWNGRPLLRQGLGPYQTQADPAQLSGWRRRPGELLPPGFRQALRWEWLLDDSLRFYGLGQRSMPLERRGTAPVNWTTDEPSGHSRSSDPLYQAHPLLWGTDGSVWWAVFLLHTPYTRFDLGQHRADRWGWLSLGEQLVWQLHAAASPSELQASLSQVFGLPSPPPLWALGFHQSRWGYRTGQEVLELAQEFRERRLPLDVVHLDIDHMDGYRSFTFCPQRFPDAAGLIAELRGLGVQTVTILDPGLRFDPGNAYAPCDSGLAGQHFLKSPSGAPAMGYCWPDEALFPDFSRAATRSWWAEQARFYLEQGVRGLWIDMNEPAIFDRPFWSGGAQQHPLPVDTPAGDSPRRFTQAAWHNLYGSHMAQASEATWNDRPERPWVLTRSGFTGVGQHAWSWMGDNTSWWEHLALSLPQLASMGLVGSPWVGVDVGGFFGHCTGELYSAWMEAAVIYPLMRAHSALGTREAHPWSFGPEVARHAQTALQLRYRLLPYYYSLVTDPERLRQPWLRPMFFEAPNDPRFFTCEDQVMVGPHLMAAPFVVRGQQQRLVQLPAGRWVDLHSGQSHDGGQAVVIARRPGLVPLFARAGSAIPMLAQAVEHSAQLEQAEWHLFLCPGPSTVTSRLYWDEGDGWGFREGRYQELEIVLEPQGPRVIRQSGQTWSRALRLRHPGPEGWTVGLLWNPSQG